MAPAAQQLFDMVASGRPGPWWLPPLRAATRAASGLYGLGTWARNLGYDLGYSRVRHLPAPVVGVGNLTVGGTGKTPLVMAVVAALTRLGLPSAVISRGYGGQPEHGGRAGQGGPATTWVSLGDGPLVDAAQAGDEPVLMARRLAVPVAVGPDRFSVGRAVLARCGPRVLVGDDLFQHRRLHRDLDIAVLDARAPLGNGRLLPAGPLREPATGLRRALAVVLTHADDPELVAACRVWLRAFWGGGPVLTCRHGLTGLADQDGRALAAQGWQGRAVLAFCGLGSPEGFAQGLSGLGLTVLGLETFPDHHPYTPAEIEALWEKARGLGAAALVTSEKDAVRLPPVTPSGLRLWQTRLELVFDQGPGSLDAVLAWGLGPWGRGL
jgi:tetraacyldisaccharide 4'-kinase